jgi:ParB-like chromosome segregation protein Spo0J
LTQEQIAAAVGKDRSSVANFMRLLKLPEEVRAISQRARSQPVMPVRCWRCPTQRRSGTAPVRAISRRFRCAKPKRS